MNLVNVCGWCEALGFIVCGFCFFKLQLLSEFLIQLRLVLAIPQRMRFIPALFVILGPYWSKLQDTVPGSFPLLLAWEAATDFWASSSPHPKFRPAQVRAEHVERLLQVSHSLFNFPAARPTSPGEKNPAGNQTAQSPPCQETRLCSERLLFRHNPIGSGFLQCQGFKTF